jgi:hypothetical protein
VPQAGMGADSCAVMWNPASGRGMP